MSVGYDKPLYILPFDHRRAYSSEIFGFKEPMTPDQIAEIAKSKGVIYDGFKRAVAGGVEKTHAGLLVDEESGAAILRDATSQGFITAMSTEMSVQTEVDFEYGEKFGDHLQQLKPTFVKVLVRYNPEGDAELNRRQSARLKRLGDCCHQYGRLYMFELLVPAEPAQLKQVGGDKMVYDRELRPGLMLRAIREIQDAGVEADIWKIEGLDRKEDCVKIAESARRDGRTKVGCIVLGRGEDEEKVLEWLGVAAKVPTFTGFAVGRSTFLEPIMSLRKGTITAEAAAQEIARRYRKWVDVFESARKSAK
jgi:myo-inositol catabolism protein IolC